MITLPRSDTSGRGRISLSLDMRVFPSQCPSGLFDGLSTCRYPDILNTLLHIYSHICSCTEAASQKLQAAVSAAFTAVNRLRVAEERASWRGKALETIAKTAESRARLALKRLLLLPELLRTQLTKVLMPYIYSVHVYIHRCTYLEVYIYTYVYIRMCKIVIMSDWSRVSVFLVTLYGHCMRAIFPY